MYRIVKDGAALALIEAPTYVRQAGNGCFVLCQEDQATGIAYGGTVYHLLGREALGRQGDALGHDPILMGNIDLCSFGEALLERDGYVLNAAGDAWLRRSGQEFRHERAETQPDQGMTMM